MNLADERHGDGARAIDRERVAQVLLAEDDHPNPVAARQPVRRVERGLRRVIGRPRAAADRGQRQNRQNGEQRSHERCPMHARPDQSHDATTYRRMVNQCRTSAARSLFNQPDRISRGITPTWFDAGARARAAAARKPSRINDMRQFFRFATCQNRKTTYIVALVRKRRRGLARRLGDKAMGRRGKGRTPNAS